VGIYGTTDFALQAYRQISTYAKRVYFIDDFYVGEQFAGVEVVNPDKAAVRKSDAYFLCSALPVTIKKMAKKLMSKGVDKNTIVSMV
jgi:hypothetical protein